MPFPGEGTLLLCPQVRNHKRKRLSAAGMPRTPGSKYYRMLFLVRIPGFSRLADRNSPGTCCSSPDSPSSLCAIHTLTCFLTEYFEAAHHQLLLKVISPACAAPQHPRPLRLDMSRAAGAQARDAGTCDPASQAVTIAPQVCNKKWPPIKLYCKGLGI